MTTFITTITPLVQLVLSKLLSRKSLRQQNWQQASHAMRINKMHKINNQNRVNPDTDLLVKSVKTIAAVKYLLLLIISTVLIACVNQPYGSYIKSEDCGDIKDLAHDAANHLYALYLPAKVKIEFTHDTNDEFGRELVRLLRHKGYAVQEFVPASLRLNTSDDKVNKTHPDTNLKSLKCSAGGRSNPTPAPCFKEEPSIELAYLLDQVGKDNLYRLILMTDQTVLSRAYYVEDNLFIAAGDWLARR